MESWLAFIAGCLGVITLVLLIWMAFVIYVLLHVRRAALAVESLAYVARDQVGRLRDATDRVCGFAGLVSSNWVKTLAVVLGAAAAYWVRRRHQSGD
ncbi:MAG: hypothetical protein HY922_15010 [Elusimicrobia bacterium]|nr:hypothetical protein [Elusimicrobiota bacterium]